MVKNFGVRIPDAVHERLVALAKAKNISLNALIIGILAEYREGAGEKRLELIEARLASLEKEVFGKK